MRYGIFGRTEPIQPLMFLDWLLVCRGSWLFCCTSIRKRVTIRVKEVVLRRVLGASTGSLLKCLNKDFLILVMLANIFADLLAFIYMKKWFAGIAYRIDMPFGMFIMANLVIVLITIITVSWQSLRAVNSKPAKVLKYE
ncbi:ABC transporter permease [Pedobacter sp. ASV28]|uniref:ABC transporter permease n=1 Tax=Pedobacter sp. ASV28 TaxID=2795123 RepID=UPI0018ED09D5|nr:FtsX-like permease family protein [Pedobacter sp. ASV28]